MTISSVLTVISILVAMFSFAYSSNKRMIIYKFSVWNWVVCVLLLLLIVYLLLFDWVFANGLYIKRLVHPEDTYLRPDQWAFIVALTLILYVGYRVIISRKIPKNNQRQVLDYYEEIISSDIGLLIGYIKRFHQKEIKSIKSNLRKGQLKESHDIECLKLEDDNDTNYEPKNIIQCIIFNKSFIEESIKQHYPLFFLENVYDITNEHYLGFQDAVYYYAATLLRTKDPTLNALRHTNNYLDDSDCLNVAYRLNEYIFSKLLFSNTTFTIKSQIWKAFGEEGLRDAETDAFYSERVSEWLDDTYWQHPARLCLAFYDILIRQLLYENIKSKKLPELESSDIYTFYIYLICDGMFSNHHIDTLNDSYAEKYLSEVTNSIFEWLKIMVKFNTMLFYPDVLNIIRCLITESSLPKTMKVKIFTHLIEEYIDLFSISANIDFSEAYKITISEIRERHLSLSREAWRQVDATKYATYSKYEDVRVMLKLSDR